MAVAAVGTKTVVAAADVGAVVVDTGTVVVVVTAILVVGLLLLLVLLPLNVVPSVPFRGQLEGGQLCLL